MSSETDMPGSHAANQAKTEPMPPTEGHADPDAAPEPEMVQTPELAAMSSSANDPQAPSHVAAGSHGDRDNSGVPALDTPMPGDAVDDDEDGTASRVPGSLGSTGADEQIDTDMERSAENTDVDGTPGTPAGPGDASGVPVTSSEPAPGTSQESGVAQGSRTPL